MANPKQPNTGRSASQSADQQGSQSQTPRKQQSQGTPSDIEGRDAPFTPNQNRFPRDDEKGGHKTQPRGEEEDAQGKGG